MTEPDVRKLAIDGAWCFTPLIHRDERGLFCEWLRQDALAEVLGHRLGAAQANLSVSAAGVVRGIHFADVPPGQAKYVACVSGAILDTVVDLRTGSPTFGLWESVLLDDVDRRSLYLAEGLGHAFVSLVDRSTVSYLCSTPYSPGKEHAVNPFDPDLDIAWPSSGRDGHSLRLQLSPRDEAAPTLADAHSRNLLPSYEAAQAWYAELRRADTSA